MVPYCTSFFSVVLQVGACFILGECSNPGTHGTSESSPNLQPEAKEEQSIPEDSGFNEINRRIYKVLSATHPCRDIEACETVEVTLKPKNPKPQSIGQRILVIDDGMVLPAYTRYKSRVIDHIFPFDDGSYQSFPSTIKVPIPVFQVLSQILDEEFPDTTARELDPVAKLFYKHKKVLNVENVEHGDENFSTLADLNPYAEFLLAGRPAMTKEIFCSTRKDKASFEKYRAFLHSTANSLRSYIEKYEINYINMSFGETTETMKADWSRLCSNQPFPSNAFFRLLLKTYFEEFLQTLFAANAIFVHSAAYSTQELSLSHPDFYCDCQEIPNRIRVTGFSSSVSHLPLTGAEAPELLQARMFGSLPCADLAVNFGVEANRPWADGPFPVFMTADGVGVESVGKFVSTSSAAPIVLSYINYLKQAGIISGEGAEFVSNLKKYHTGRFIEPARYRQFELYRLGRQ